MPGQEQPKQYLDDLKEWQDKQYLPGAFTGSKMPFPLKRLGGKKWFRVWSLVFLAIFFLAVAFSVFQMSRYILNGQ